MPDGRATSNSPRVKLITAYLYSVGAAKPDTWAREIAELLDVQDGRE